MDMVVSQGFNTATEQACGKKTWVSGKRSNLEEDLETDEIGVKKFVEMNSYLSTAIIVVVYKMMKLKKL